MEFRLQMHKPPSAAKQAAEKGSEECPQALKRIECKPFMSELKLRPPKKRLFSANCKAAFHFVGGDGTTKVVP